jgi:hypothetical protein
MRDLFCAHGFTVWWDEHLQSGNFTEQFEPQIQQSRAVVTLWCPDTKNSQWVKNEALLARKLKKIIDTKLTDNDVTEVLPFGSYDVRLIDLSRWSGDPCDVVALDALFTELERLVGRSTNIDRKLLLALSRQWRDAGQKKLANFTQGERDPEGPADKPLLPSATRQFLPGEEEEWMEIVSSDDLIDFVAFAEKFPEGRMEKVALAEAARIRDRLNSARALDER